MLERKPMLFVGTLLLITAFGRRLGLERDREIIDKQDTKDSQQHVAAGAEDLEKDTNALETDTNAIEDLNALEKDIHAIEDLGKVTSLLEEQKADVADLLEDKADEKAYHLASAAAVLDTAKVPCCKHKCCFDADKEKYKGDRAIAHFHFCSSSDGCPTGEENTTDRRSTRLTHHIETTTDLKCKVLGVAVGGFVRCDSEAALLAQEKKRNLGISKKKNLPNYRKAMLVLDLTKNK